MSLFKINLKGVATQEGVDWDFLVSKCEGYSGADIANVCRDAAMMPMRKRLLSGNFGFNLEEIQKLEREVEVPLSMQDFLVAFKNIQKSVAADSLKMYQEWMKEFGAV